ncbi:class I SAM-dependent methyltransferase [Nocardioides pocheonensis]|uniref:Class I SAM-dependent methyltransferase n=1 Tax=Nocardioides pocheonensis TaxID=661485 RepID=A0A3N0GN15_9ACTN|nr:class I SAM-dependent methyltransferase [Nocardioides pocheonensis]RNM13789.1 class I SAM-dependent methyltransferase [Nocardioides pocheonensis]
MQSPNERAFAGNNESAARWFATQPNWWDEHFHGAVKDAFDTLHGSGVSTSGKDLLDVGCGDGIISLGLLRNGDLRSVMGIDIVDVDRDFLDTEAERHGVEPVGPEEALRFVRSEPDTVPAPDESFDLATAWSVFEHVTHPRPLLAEVLRVLRPGGVFFLQVWPLWFSEHGSHLWPFFDETFVHLTKSPEEIRAHLDERLGSGPLASGMFDLYQSCNRLTVDDIQAALRAVGFHLGMVRLSGSAIHVPPQLQDVPVSKLAIEGFSIIAVKPG